MFKSFGVVIPGLKIFGRPAPYAVINERAARAATGIMLSLATFSWVQSYYRENHFYMKVFTVLFFLDFSSRFLFGVRNSPLNRIGALLTKSQQPEWVGAEQKKYAFGIGLGMSLWMSIATNFAPGDWSIPYAICGMCIAFMFLEVALSFCAGCWLHGRLLSYKIIPDVEHRPACVGDSCAIAEPTKIAKVS